MPARNLRTTFSQVSALSGMRARSSLSSISPPVFSFWLWQVTQYWSRTARCEDALWPRAVSAINNMAAQQLTVFIRIAPGHDHTYRGGAESRVRDGAGMGLCRSVKVSIAVNGAAK